MTISGAQKRVADWVRTTFGEASANEPRERSLRMLEEACELTQAIGVSRHQAHLVVDYVYNRPAGSAPQEIAGTLITLLGTSAALDIDTEEAFLLEAGRIEKPEVLERCRKRQSEKRRALGVL